MLFPELCQGPCLLEAPDLPGQAMQCKPCQASKYALQALPLWRAQSLPPEPLAQLPQLRANLALTLPFMTGTDCRCCNADRTALHTICMISQGRWCFCPAELPGCQWLLTTYMSSFTIRLIKTLLCRYKKLAMQKQVSALPSH